jgi:hypothetical protein
MDCDHSGTHSGALRYLRTQEQLRLVIVCDACGAECAELGLIEYRTPSPTGIAWHEEQTAQRA